MRKKASDKSIKNKSILIFLSIICFIALFESIGFSAFQQNLVINDITSSFRLQTDIRITGVSYAEEGAFIHDASTNYEEYNKDNISSSINLPYADSSVTYKVKITNIGNVEMGIYSLSGLPNNLDYEVLDYELGKDKLCETKSGIEQCKLGIEDYVNIKIKYKEGMYNSSNTTYDFTLKFDFESFHPVTADNNIINYISNYPTEVMNKATLKFNFDESSNMELAIYVSSQQVDYEYENGEVTLRNVEGPVEIKGENKESLLLIPGSTISGYFNNVRWFHSSYQKTRLVFTTKDRLPSTAVNKDSSSGPYNICAEEGNEDAITIYVNNETIYIAATGNTIKFGEDVSGLFSGANIKKTIAEIVIDEGVTVIGSDAKIFDFMFKEASAMTQEQINNFLKVFEGANPTSMNQTFYGLSTITSLDLSPFDFGPNATYSTGFLNQTFYNDRKLITIYVKSSYQLPSNIGTQQGTFTNCNKLVGGNGTGFNNKNVSSQYARIDTSSTPGYFTAK